MRLAGASRVPKLGAARFVNGHGEPHEVRVLGLKQRVLHVEYCPEVGGSNDDDNGNDED